MLGVYAQRVVMPLYSTAVTGLHLMTALNPPTRASQPDADGRRHREHRPGSLGTEPVDPAPCEASDGHPVLAHLPRFHMRGPDEKLLCMKRCLVGLKGLPAAGVLRLRTCRHSPPGWTAAMDGPMRSLDRRRGSSEGSP